MSQAIWADIIFNGHGRLAMSRVRTLDECRQHDHGFS